MFHGLFYMSNTMVVVFLHFFISKYCILNLHSTHSGECRFKVR